MKKIISLILALGLWLMPVLLYAAAATITSRDRISLGNFAAVTGLVTPNSGDTIATGLRRVIFFTMEENPASGANPATTSTRFHWSAGATDATAGTITVRPSTDAVRYRFFAIGTP